MNSIFNIVPYKDGGIWMFDDDSRGIKREAFVAGADTIIQNAVELKQIPNAEAGFNMTFSAGRFPDFDLMFEKQDGDATGTDYWSPDFRMKGWLCPALFAYFDVAPEHLYVRFRPLET